MVENPHPNLVHSKAGWPVVVGAVFGAITLAGLFGFAFLAGTSSPQFICRSFQLLASVFALGAALSAAFIGGGATATSTAPFSLVISVGGGVAVLFIAFFSFNYFAPKSCAYETELAAKQYSSALGQLQQARDLADPISKALGDAVTWASNAKTNKSDVDTCVLRHQQAQEQDTNIKNSFDNMALLLKTAAPLLPASISDLGGKTR
jgi:hypothetical protein